MNKPNVCHSLTQIFCVIHLANLFIYCSKAWNLPLPFTINWPLRRLRLLHCLLHIFQPPTYDATNASSVGEDPHPVLIQGATLRAIANATRVMASEHLGWSRPWYRSSCWEIRSYGGFGLADAASTSLSRALSGVNLKVREGRASPDQPLLHRPRNPLPPFHHLLGPLWLNSRPSNIGDKNPGGQGNDTPPPAIPGALRNEYHHLSQPKNCFCPSRVYNPCKTIFITNLYSSHLSRFSFHHTLASTGIQSQRQKPMTIDRLGAIWLLNTTPFTHQSEGMWNYGSSMLGRGEDCGSQGRWWLAWWRECGWNAHEGYDFHRQGEL